MNLNQQKSFQPQEFSIVFGQVQSNVFRIPLNFTVFESLSNNPYHPFMVYLPIFTIKNQPFVNIPYKEHLGKKHGEHKTTQTPHQGRAVTG